MSDEVLQVKDLSVDFFVEDEWVPAVKNMSYSVSAGKVLAIVGETGSGKTQSSMSLIGLLPKNGRATGSVLLGNKELIGLNHHELQNIRGQDISVIFQEPMTALNPVYTIGFQIVETIRAHKNISKKAAIERALELLKLVEMPEPEKRLNYYPSQLSGGQRQRAMIAQSLCLDPKILIADEPTTALDVTVQAEILQLMRNLKDKVNSSIILITHDMGVVADMADDICVMKDGIVVEYNTADNIFYNPQHEYTQTLLKSVPKLGKTLTHKYISKYGTDYEHNPQPVLVAKNICVEFAKKGSKEMFKAVDDLTVDINKREIVGLVGESGSGKTTFGRSIVGLQSVKSGELTYLGAENGKPLNVLDRKRHNLHEIQKDVSIVFQDPASSLNPRLPIGESIGEPVYLLKHWKKDKLYKYVRELLEQVKLPSSFINRYPHELSGGQRQRIGIARALALKPRLLIADEPTSALDVSVQATVLELLKELHQEHGFACLFITHDLAVVEEISSRIIVMSEGKLVEQGSTKQILENPQDEYTKKLIASIPIPDPKKQAIRRAKNSKYFE
jgi:peptide/nickel transport system ATP-binding protein